jgi:hypothetical protein
MANRILDLAMKQDWTACLTELPTASKEEVNSKDDKASLHSATPGKN